MIALAYGSFDSLYEELRETSDYYNHIGAAFTSGALFKSTAGIRPALIAGTLLSGCVLGFQQLEPFISNIN